MNTTKKSEGKAIKFYILPLMRWKGHESIPHGAVYSRLENETLVPAGGQMENLPARADVGSQLVDHFLELVVQREQNTTYI